MTNEETFEQIQSYIDDIKGYIEKEGTSPNEKQHLRRALDAYTSLYTDAVNGKIDPELVHENITSFLYMLQ